VCTFASEKDNKEELEKSFAPATLTGGLLQWGPQVYAAQVHKFFLFFALRTGKNQNTP
jgi:hypothetical protein